MQTDEPLDQLRLRFKTFLNARLADGTIALFRFYDPRVFRTYIAAATSEEHAPWFKGILRYSIESSEPGQFHDFRLENGTLHDGNMLVES